MSTAIAPNLVREGIAAAKAGNKPLTRQLLRQATELDPSSELAWLWLAGAAETPQAGIECLQRVLAINPRNDRARQGLLAIRLQAGIAEAKAGHKAAARAHLQLVVEQDPQHELAWLWLAGAAETPQAGIDCLQRVLAINPANTRARQGLEATRLEAGVGAARAGQKEAARAFLLPLTQANPRHELAWQWLASVAETTEDAIACLERALELNPANARAREGLEWYRTHLAAATPLWQCPLCQASAAEAHELCPTCGAQLAVTNLDSFFTRKGVQAPLLREAIARLEDAAEASADFAACWNLGLAYLNLCQVAESLANFQDALRLRPSDRDLRRLVTALERRKAEEDENERQKRERQRCVLVVDDSPTVRKLVTMTLEKQGYRVVAAADGHEATNWLAKDAPHLVLLDITMPGMDGYQLCKLIRANPGTSSIPVVMLSGKDGFFDKIRGRLAGSNEYVTKPFKPEDVLKVVRRHCGAPLCLTLAPPRICTVNDLAHDLPTFAGTDATPDLGPPATDTTEPNEGRRLGRRTGHVRRPSPETLYGLQTTKTLPDLKGVFVATEADTALANDLVLLLSTLEYQRVRLGAMGCAAGQVLENLTDMLQRTSAIAKRYAAAEAAEPLGRVAKLLVAADRLRPEFSASLTQALVGWFRGSALAPAERRLGFDAFVTGGLETLATLLARFETCFSTPAAAADWRQAYTLFLKELRPLLAGGKA